MQDEKGARWEASRYRLRQMLGKGGMGEVYIAEDMRECRLAALKVIREDMGQDPKMKKRFVQEFRVFSFVKHENIVQVYDSGETEDHRLYLALEYVYGGCLRDLRHVPLPLGVIIDIMIQLSEALSQAHARGIVHRDLKPENILLTLPTDDRLVIKLADFGLASLPAQLDGTSQFSGTILGTPGYMAPEQARGMRGVTGLGTDIYAMGVILFELLCGRLPFQGMAGMSTILMHIKNPVPDLEFLPHLHLSQSLKDSLSAIVKKAMSKKPWLRYANASEFKLALLALGVARDALPPLTHIIEKREETERLYASMCESRKKMMREGILDADGMLRQPGTELQSSLGDFEDRDLGWGSTMNSDFPGEKRNTKRSFFPMPQRLYGMESELSVLKYHCSEARRGIGGIGIVYGASGNGKTMLLRTLDESLRQDMRVIRRSFDGDSKRTLRHFFELILGCEKIPSDALDGFVRNKLSDLSIRESEDTPRFIKTLRPTRTDLQGNDSVWAPLADVSYAFYQDLMAAVVQNQPLLLILDDLQCAQNDDLHFIEAMLLAFRYKSLRFYICCGLESTDNLQNGSIRNRILSMARLENRVMKLITVDPLGDDYMRELLTESMKTDAEVTDFVIDRSEGNVADAIALLNHLERLASIQYDAARGLYRFYENRNDTVNLPPSIQEKKMQSWRVIEQDLGTRVELYFEILLRTAIVGRSGTTAEVERMILAENDPALVPIWVDAYDYWLRSSILNERNSGYSFNEYWMWDFILSKAGLRKFKKLHKLAGQILRSETKIFDFRNCKRIAEHMEHGGEREQGRQYRILAVNEAKRIGNLHAARETGNKVIFDFYKLASKARNRDEFEKIYDFPAFINDMAFIAVEIGAAEDAAVMSERLLRYAEQFSWSRAEAFHYNIQALLAFRRGEFGSARSNLNAAAEKFRTCKDEYYVAVTRMEDAVVCCFTGDIPEARTLCLDAQQYFVSNNHFLEIANCDLTLAFASLRSGLINDCLTFLNAAEESYKNASMPVYLLVVDLLRTQLDAIEGNVEKAALRFKDLSEQFGAMSLQFFAASAMLSSARSLLEAGNITETQKTLDLMEYDIEKLENAQLKARAQLVQSRVYACQKIDVLSEQELQDAMSYFTMAGDKQGTGLCYEEFTIWELSNSLGDPESCFNSAHECFTAAHDLIGIVHSALLWAKICETKNAFEKALAAAAEAVERAETLNIEPLLAFSCAYAMVLSAYCGQEDNIKRYFQKIGKKPKVLPCNTAQFVDFIEDTAKYCQSSESLRYLTTELYLLKDNYSTKIPSFLAHF